MTARSYELRVAPSARRTLHQIPYRYALAVLAFLAGPLSENPRRVGKLLHFELAGWLAARVGGYRIVYWIDEDEAVVIVERIEHRGDVYRRR